MLYIIDGYNLMFKVLRAGDDLQKQRITIIKDLNAKVQLLGIDALLVFDAQYKYGEAQRSHYNHLEIHFTAQGEIADDYILKHVKNSPQPGEIIVVTSDKKLSMLSRRRGAKAETVDEFLSLLNRRYRNKLKQLNEPPAVLTTTPLEEPKKELKPKLKDTPEQCFEFYLDKFEKELLEQGVKPQSTMKKKTRLVKPVVTEHLSDEERWLREFTRPASSSD